MSIDVYFYTKLDLDILKERVSKIEKKHPDVFGTHYGVNIVRDACQVDHDALKYDAGVSFDVKTVFTVGLWYKATDFLTQDLAALVKKEFSPDPVVALFEAETLL